MTRSTRDACGLVGLVSLVGLVPFFKTRGEKRRACHVTHDWTEGVHENWVGVHKRAVDVNGAAGSEKLDSLPLSFRPA